MSEQNPYNAPLPFRAPEITQAQLDDLKKKWGENRSKVIIRCIERVWLQEIGNRRDKEQPSNKTEDE